MFNLIQPNVEGYIREVLHREYLNIVADLEIHSMDAIDTNPDYTWLLRKQNENIKPQQTIIKSNNNEIISLKRIKGEIISPPLIEQNNNDDNLEPINYDDLIDCLTSSQAPNMAKIEQSLNLKTTIPIQNLSEIFNKTVNNNSINNNNNNNSTIHLVDNSTQLKISSNSYQHHHHHHHHNYQQQQHQQMLNVLLVPGGGLGFLSVVKNN